MVNVKLVACWGACILLLGGCAQGADIPASETSEPRSAAFTLDASEWSDAQLSALYRAADRWNSLADRPAVELTVVEGSRRSHHIAPARLPEHRSGMHTPGVETIRIDVDQADDEFETVVIHELGHALGLGHVDAPGIMNAVVDGSVVDFTHADQGECTRVGTCRAID